MAWGGPVEPAPRRESWKKDIQRGPRPGDSSAAAQDPAVPDRLVAAAFTTQVSFGLAFVVLVVAATVFYAQYSGALRWLIAVGVLTAGAYIVVRFVGTRTRDPRSFRPVPQTDSRATGDLRSLSTTLDRASAGLKYSQVMFAARMAEAFLEKVRLSRGIRPEDMRLMHADPERLLELIGDVEVVTFILKSERDHRHWPELLSALRSRPGFAGEADRMLAKMEAWR